MSLFNTGYFHFGRGNSGATDIMTFSPTNQVGIGTSVPSADLDLVGTLQYVDGNEGANKVLTSDASGNATWQTTTGDGNGIYDGSGTVPTTTAVTLTDNINFDANTFIIDGTSNEVGVGVDPTNELDVDGDVLVRDFLRIEGTGTAYDMVIGDVASVNTFQVNNHDLKIDLTNATADFIVEVGATNNYQGLTIDQDAQVSFRHFTFPNADGTSGQVLETDGAGSLSWTTPSGATDTNIAENNLTQDANRTLSQAGFNLDISDGAGNYTRINDNSWQLIATGGATVVLDAESTYGRIGTSNSQEFRIYTGNTERVAYESDGDIEWDSGTMALDATQDTVFVNGDFSHKYQGHAVLLRANRETENSWTTVGDTVRVGFTTSRDESAAINPDHTTDDEFDIVKDGWYRIDVNYPRQDNASGVDVYGWVGKKTAAGTTFSEVDDLDVSMYENFDNAPVHNSHIGGEIYLENGEHVALFFELATAPGTNTANWDDVRMSIRYLGDY